ncbi:SCL-interrupting locus protein N-terminus-domain-containing protein [Pavlovales sp. CCMP2436]|nr:SCL-interrupting locus protein N-terminus-domain-containing protein [Pavlovales sp. CCMP2436]
MAGFGFPAVSSVLWDRTSLGDELGCVPPQLALRVSPDATAALCDEIEASAHQHAKTDRPLLGWLVGVLRIDQGAGLCATAESFVARGRSQRAPPPQEQGALCIPVHRARATDLSALGAQLLVQASATEHADIERRCEAAMCSHSPIDVADFAPLLVVADADVPLGTLSLHIAGCLSTLAFRARPVRALRVAPSPLAASVLGGFSKLDGFAGFLSMDQSRKAVLLTVGDPLAYEVPLIGVWVACASHPSHPAVWAACVRFRHAREVQRRATPDETARPFVVLVVGAVEASGGAPRAAWFECTDDSDSADSLRLVPLRARTTLTAGVAGGPGSSWDTIHLTTSITAPTHATGAGTATAGAEARAAVHSARATGGGYAQGSYGGAIEGALLGWQPQQPHAAQPAPRTPVRDLDAAPPWPTPGPARVEGAPEPEVEPVRERLSGARAVRAEIAQALARELDGDLSDLSDLASETDPGEAEELEAEEHEGVGGGEGDSEGQSAAAESDGDAEADADAHRTLAQPIPGRRAHGSPPRRSSGPLQMPESPPPPAPRAAPPPGAAEEAVRPAPPGGSPRAARAERGRESPPELARCDQSVGGAIDRAEHLAAASCGGGEGAERLAANVDELTRALARLGRALASVQEQLHAQQAVGRGQAAQLCAQAGRIATLECAQLAVGGGAGRQARRAGLGGEGGEADAASPPRPAHPQPALRPPSRAPPPSKQALEQRTQQPAADLLAKADLAASPSGVEDLEVPRIRFSAWPLSEDEADGGSDGDLSDEEESGAGEEETHRYGNMLRLSTVAY